jgi:hypothetical protein
MGLLAMGIVAGMSFSVYTTMHMDKEKQEKEEKGNKTKNNEKEKTSVSTKKEHSNVKEKIQMNPLDETVTVDSEKDKRELTLVEVKNKENEVRQLMREFRFSDAEEILYEMNRKYTFNTKEAKILDNLFHDASALSNLHVDGDMGEGATGEGIINIMNSLKDPESLLLGTLIVDAPTREKIILSEQSLNPIYSKLDLAIIQKNIETGDMLKEVKILYPETKALHKISFGLEGFMLNAYIIEYPDGSLRFHSIKDPSGKAPYLTIAQWEKIRKNLHRGKAAFDGVLEKQETTSPQEVNPPQEIPSVESQSAHSNQ